MLYVCELGCSYEGLKALVHWRGQKHGVRVESPGGLFGIGYICCDHSSRYFERKDGCWNMLEKL
jgi:hypothetical protein